MNENESPEVDAVTLGLIRGVLASAKSEIESLIDRTSMSPVINEKKDYFAGYTDAAGRALSLTSPLGSNKVEEIFATYPPDTMKPGDLYWYNDCYGSHGGVTHSPDMVFIAPVFVDQELIAFCEAFGHFWDIGGMRPGSMSPEATEVFQEGVIVPPVRIQRGGEWNEDLVRTFLRNSRFPEMLQGDIRAMTAAVQLGVSRMSEIAHRFGPQKLVKVLDIFISQTRDALHARVRQVIPEGTLCFAEPVETSTGDGPLWIRLKVERRGSHVGIDLIDSDDQSRGPANYIMHESVPPLALSQSVMANDATIMFNAGAREVVDSVAIREGSIIQPRFPAALGSRGSTWQRFASAVQGVIAQASGGESSAASANYCLYLLRSFDPETGRWILCTDGIAVGRGARSYSDGPDAIYYTGQKNFPIEYMEMTFPIRMNQYGIHCDSGGPGRYRGGCGVVREFTFLRDRGELAPRIDNVAFTPWGVSGGMGGRPGSVVMNPGTPNERRIAPMSDGTRIEEGDVVRISTSGGGGWGHPFDREAEAVRHDVMCGFVSLESARADYGVMLDPGTFELDPVGTKELRSSERSVKLFHRSEYVDEIW
jgi:N-methylhydantoinase B